MTYRSYILTLCVFVLGLGCLDARAQVTQSSDFRALRFNGGVASLDIRFGSNLFGSGQSGGAFSNINSSMIRSDGASVFGNPALLSLIPRPQIGFESRIPVRSSTLGIGSSDKLPFPIQRHTDRFLENLSFPATENPIYTSTTHSVIGQPRQLSAFWLTWPVTKTVGIGFGYRQPFLFTSSISLSGLSVYLTGQKEQNATTTQVDFSSEFALSSSATLQMDELSIGTGGLLESYSIGTVWWGATLYRYGAAAKIGLDVLPQGYISIDGGDPHYFNDIGDPHLNPEQGEGNTMFWKIKGGYSGSGFGARFGAVHRTYYERFGSSVLIDLAPKVLLWDGDAYASSYMPEFVDLEGSIDNADPEAHDLLDLSLLDLNKPNLTRQTHDAMGQWIKLHMPSSVTFGADYPFGRHNLVVNLSRYWGIMAVEGEYGLKNGILRRYKLGRAPSWGIKMGLDVGREPRRDGRGSWNIPLRILTLDIDGVLMELLEGWTLYDEPRYRFSASTQWGSSVVDGLDNTVSTDISAMLGGFKPTSFAISRSYTLFDQLDVGVHVIGVPDLIMRFSFGLNLN